MLALAGLLNRAGLSAEAARTTDFRGAAKHVIFCYMSGGVSHIDSFDPKPKLQELAGQPMPVEVQRTMFNNNGNIFPSPFKFQPCGRSGIPVSNMFPEIGKLADELAVIRSMTTSVSEHAQANCLFHTGFPFLGHPSAGAWASYGLGSENENLPGFVVLQSGSAVVPHGGVGMFGNGYLPAQHQASIIKADRAEPVANIKPRELPQLQRAELDFVHQLDQQFAVDSQNENQIDAAIRNYETAWRMQTAVPDLCDLKDESATTMAMYGIDSSDPEKAAYARQCLVARRLVERGVRFIELSCLTKGIGAGGAANPWDQHGDLEKGHGAMAFQVDQPIAALIRDLKQRGLLDETLIVWAGEFGRTPFSQGSNGRDHNPFGFSVFLAGGGVRGGTIYGATDELGYYAVENKATVYDLWATVLHQLGIDHRELTYRYGGRDFRLTDVHGDILHQVLS
jgi:hypothetical protein